jgi:alpha-tubulin suppressor-like RCC1 family protein
MQNNQFITPLGDVSGKAFLTEYYIIDYYLGDKLFSWGQNSLNSQLGINNSDNSLTPVTTFAGGSEWRSVSSGHNQAAAIKTNGTLWMWGDNTTGQLGTNEIAKKSTPVTTFAGGNNWKQISVGKYNTAAIKTDGTLWAWGTSTGLNDNTIRYTQVNTFAGGSDWKQVSSGHNITAAIKTDGTLWVWGQNVYGELGTNTLTQSLTPVTTFAGGSDWKHVTCSANGSYNGVVAIKTDGSLWTWGHNDNGQLGINNTITKSTPVTTFAGGNNWKSANLGRAIKNDGSLWVWGNNSDGQLGINTSTSSLTPVTTFAGGNDWKQVGRFGLIHTAAVKTDGTLWVWGSNNYGQLGTNDNITRSTPVTTFSGGTNWKQVSTSYYSTHAVQAGGSIAESAAAVQGPPTTTVVGQQAYTTSGTFSWTCPANVYSVCVVCVGGGAGGIPGNGGSGGGLGWKNNIPVIPGQSYTVVVGSGGGITSATRSGGGSYFISPETVSATGGGGQSTVGTYIGDGGGNGGKGYWSGGGAGGYSGNGGNADTASGSTGSGGGGGARGVSASYPGYVGGGVGIYGQGSNGGIGGAGSGGSGSLYGGGGGCGNGYTGGTAGTRGAVRLIWGPDNSRAFPSTNTGDLTNIQTYPTVEYSMVGGGAAATGIAAGAGGVVRSSSFNATSATYTITVGSAGIHSNQGTTDSPDGGDSTIGGIASATGGQTGLTGTYYGNGGPNADYVGGIKFQIDSDEGLLSAGGGGAGAGGNGLQGSSGTFDYITYHANGGNGGNGTALGIISPVVTVGGGGGGGGSQFGQNGGGGTGSLNAGGGGGVNQSGQAGRVVLRTLSTYPTATTTGSPSVYVSGSYRIYDFTTSGTISFMAGT